MISKRAEKNLKAEIRRLQAENTFLRTHVQAKQNEQSLHANDSKGYFSYLWGLAKSNPLYKLIRRLINYFSKFRLISLTLRILGFIAVAIETSAFIFIFITLLTVLLPPIILGFLIILVCSASRFHHDGKQIRQDAKDKNIIVYFPSRQHSFGENSFFCKNALDLSQRNYCVIIVSPFIISPAGLTTNKGSFLNVKKEADGVFIIRQRYFFYAKKKIFKGHEKRLIYVY